MTKLEEFMKMAVGNPELEARMEACDSPEEIFEVVKDYGVSWEELRQVLDQIEAAYQSGDERFRQYEET